MKAATEQDVSTPPVNTTGHDLSFGLSDSLEPSGTTLKLGLDIGSTTVKAVILDGTKVVFSDYRRHNADVRGELKSLLRSIGEKFPVTEFHTTVTGSGGLVVADLMGTHFVQEVIASTEAVQRFVPEADVVIELGGEDAKITYLRPTPEQRMNGTCAGGTGAFIDQMASLLQTDASGLDELASRYQNLYPIASRCGVFAKSDLQPLLNQGAPHTDLAASVFQAVALQTISGLACGHPIRGNLVFLGGPLHFLPQLREAYKRALDGMVDSFSTPENAQLFVAIGAALLATGEARTVSDMLAGLTRVVIPLELATPSLRPLFADDAEREDFRQRHSQADVPRGSLTEATGPCFLGIDAGSTTIKAVVIDGENRLLHSHYASNRGDPVSAAIEIVREVHAQLPSAAWLGRACVTGYGESLIQAALRVDDGEVETMAHYRAADHLSPGVTSVIDIGGQDMKYLKIRNGAVDSISVNEACSAGCGSFLQTFAETMGTDVSTFATMATESARPVDLGSRCTVFMNSSVKQAQKEGSDVADISAGLSYSVVRNALYKVIKLKNAEQLGDKVVVQGGTFLNDAVLRAFELQTKTTVVRPVIAGLMGAFGAALTAASHYVPGERSEIMRPSELELFSLNTSMDTCRLCQNHCQLTISTFGDGTRHVSGNRCERGASTERVPKKSEVPNLYDYKYRRMFSYRRLTEKAATRGDIGIPRVLNMYENFPFWFTVLTKLGFRVLISGRSGHDTLAKGAESIPSENVCYPAKLTHGHIEDLLDRGVKRIFYPCVPYERQQFAEADNHYNCPIVAFYPQVLEKNVERLEAADVEYMAPFLNLDQPELLAERLTEIFAADKVSLAEAQAAIAAGLEEDAKAKADVLEEGRRAMEWIAENDARGIILAGRPYHIDPEINRGIPELITGLGMAVMTEDAVIENPKLERPLRVRDQWAYHTRLYEAATVSTTDPRVELVQLNSFGCGVDAITTDQVQEIIEAADNVYTVLKIDEVSNLGAARIRLRSLKAAASERRHSAEIATYETDERVSTPPVFTKANKKTHKIYAPQMAPIHFRLIAAVARRLGYDIELLEHANTPDVEVGLSFVNNDACYPAIMVVGQLVNKFLTGGGDPDNSSVIITQTGGMCRATNYAGMLRKALKDAGYEQVPVIAVSAQGLEENPGFAITPALVHRGVQAIVLGDLLQTVLLRVRPYEAQEGSSQALYERWDAICQEFFTDGGYSKTLRRRMTYGGLVRRIVAEFDALPLRDIPRKPRVGLVGEILVKFHPVAKNHAVQVFEDEGCVAVLPGLLEFFGQALHTGDWRSRNLGLGRESVRAKKIGLWALELYQAPVRKALRATGGKFEVQSDMETMAERAQEVISLGTSAGEGWLLTAEMMELIESGTPNIICAQPFACLPNHVVGKGMFRELRRLYPQANITSIDYDPGASEVNQLNRIKLVVASAHKAHQLVDSSAAVKAPVGS